MRINPIFNTKLRFRGKLDREGRSILITDPIIIGENKTDITNILLNPTPPPTRKRNEEI